MSTTNALVLFGGPAGAGKSTFAAAWCATRERAVHLQLDDVRSLIVSGLADPQSNDGAVGPQYKLSVRACCRLAAVFLEASYDVAIDDVLEPSAFEEAWRPALGSMAFTAVIVLPSLDETLQRSRNREKHVREDLTRSQYEACEQWPEELRLDTTGLSVRESLVVARDRGMLA